MVPFILRNNRTGTTVTILLPEWNDPPQMRAEEILMGRDAQRCTWSGHATNEDRRSCFRDRITLFTIEAMIEFGGEPARGEIAYCVCADALQIAIASTEAVLFKDVGYSIARRVKGVIVEQLDRDSKHCRCCWCGHLNPKNNQLPTTTMCRRCRTLQRQLAAEQGLLESSSRCLPSEPVTSAEVLIWSETATAFVTHLPVGYEVRVSGSKPTCGDDVLHELKLPSAVDLKPLRAEIQQRFGSGTRQGWLTPKRPDQALILSADKKAVTAVQIRSKRISDCRIRDSQGEFATMKFGRPLHCLEFLWLAFRVLLSKRWEQRWDSFRIEPRHRFKVNRGNICSQGGPTDWLNELVACCSVETHQARHLGLSETDIRRLERLLHRIKVFRSRRSRRSR